MRLLLSAAVFPALGDILYFLAALTVTEVRCLASAPSIDIPSTLTATNPTMILRMSPFI
jgi:hypothetical protein